MTARQLAIAPIAAFTATGDQDRLRAALITGLEAGLAVNQIKEVLVQMYAYAGFPRSLNALGTFMTVVQERDGRDEIGPEPTPLPEGSDVLAALAALTGTESHLRSHLNIGLNTGLTEPRLRDLVQVIRAEVGQEQGEAAARVLDQVLETP